MKNKIVFEPYKNKSFFYKYCVVEINYEKN